MALTLLKLDRQAAGLKTKQASGTKVTTFAAATTDADRQITFDPGAADRVVTLTGDTTLQGTNTGDQTISDATITTTDVTTNNATTLKHGFSPKLPGGTTTFYRADGAFAAPTASVAITEAEIDVGATPVVEAIIPVVDAGVTTNSRVIGGVAYKAPTGKDLDELDMDALELKFEPLAGSMNVHIKGLEGAIEGAFKIWYTFA